MNAAAGPEPAGSPPAAKAWAENYRAAPFVFLLESLHGNRLVAWADDPGLIQRGFLACLESFPDSVEVLVKILPDPARAADTWVQHRGTATRRQVRSALETHAHLLLGDGALQFFVQDPVQDRHLSLDDHGILELTSAPAALLPHIVALGFDERFDDLLNEYPHHHRAPVDAALLRTALLADLALGPAHPVRP